MKRCNDYGDTASAKMWVPTGMLGRDRQANDYAVSLLQGKAATRELRRHKSVHRLSIYSVRKNLSADQKGCTGQ